MQYTSVSFDLAHIIMQKYVFRDFHTACIRQNQKVRNKNHHPSVAKNLQVP